MVLGFGKDANTDNRHEPSTLEKQGGENQTERNNIDPARNRVNPQVLTSTEFIRNSLTYGMRVPTGATSTWDRRLTPETEAFHEALAAHHGGRLDKTTTTTEGESEDKYREPTVTSVNNYLLGQMNDMGEGMRQESAGRQRGRDVEEPAHHFNFHTPTLHDRVHGAMNLVGGKVRMDQDIETRGRAEFKGQTDDGH